MNTLYTNEMVSMAIAKVSKVTRFTMTELPSLAEIVDDLKSVNGKLSRSVTEYEVEAALLKRASSTRNVVRIWGGFVSNSYGYKAEAAVVALYRDGTYRCYRGSCKRSFGRGNTLTESNS